MVAALTLALLGLLTQSCRRTPAPAPRAETAPTADTARAAVLAELGRYYDDFSARDWNAYTSHFWPGATLTTVWTPPGAPVARVMSLSVPEFVRQTPQGPDSKPIFEERMTGADLRVIGNLAQAWVRYSARFGDRDSVITWKGVDAFTLMRHEGRWRITSLAYTDTPD